MKKEYLTVYDYGQGGVWAVITANSLDEIKLKYPVLTTFEKLPDWMSKSRHDEIRSHSYFFDIDEEPPNWLALAMKNPEE